MNGIRRLEFPLGTPYHAMMKALVSALDDEGLRLNDSNAKDRITTVIIGGAKLMLVPESRIAHETGDTQ